ncbi:MAG: hypothetical protein ACOX2X_06735 [Peptococcia bacterium]|jgi:hypothetical protein
MTKRRITLVAVLFTFILQCFPVTVLAAVDADTEKHGLLYRSISSYLSEEYKNFNEGLNLIKQTDTYKKVAASKFGLAVKRDIKNFSMLGDLGSAAINYGVNSFNKGVAGTKNNINALIALPGVLMNKGKDILTTKNTVQLNKVSSDLGVKKGRVIDLGAFDNGITSLLSSPIKIKKDAQTGLNIIVIKGKPKAANMDICIIPGKTLNLSNASLLPDAPAHSIMPENDIR